MYSTLLTVALFFTFAINAVFADFAVSNPEINAVCHSLSFLTRSNIFSSARVVRPR